MSRILGSEAEPLGLLRENLGDTQLLGRLGERSILCVCVCVGWLTALPPPPQTAAFLYGPWTIAAAATLCHPLLFFWLVASYSAPFFWSLFSLLCVPSRLPCSPERSNDPSKCQLPAVVRWEKTAATPGFADVPQFLSLHLNSEYSSMRWTGRRLEKSRQEQSKRGRNETLWCSLLSKTAWRGSLSLAWKSGERGSVVMTTLKWSHFWRRRRGLDVLCVDRVPMAYWLWGLIYWFKGDGYCSINRSTNGRRRFVMMRGV